MKPLLVFARIIIVGCLWSIVFIEGIRVIMLCNWHFDIFWPDHWQQFFDLWKAGWEISAPKEWAFILILITFFPMLITGWWTLCLVSWEDIIADILMLPVKLYRRFIKAPINVITTNNKYGVVKRKSYKQIRPLGVGHSRVPISDYGTVQPALSSSPAAAPALAYTPAQTMSSSLSSATARVANKVQKTDIPATIDHALFKFDDDDDDFDLDIDSFEKTDILASKKSAPKKVFDEDIAPEPRPKKQPQAKRKAENFEFEDDDFDKMPKKKKRDEKQNERPEKKSRDEQNKKSAESAQNLNNGPVYDVLHQKGYDIISNITVGDTIIEYAGVSDSQICLCLVDKESGDWLADEELFNGEDPLWFSEDSHRVSPVRKIDIARKKIEAKLEDAGFNLEVVPYVVIMMANIINADDMFEIWNDLNIEVTRINRGAPKEIRLLSKTIPEAEGSLSQDELNNLRKLLKSLK